MAEDQPTIEYRDLTPLGFPGYRVGDDGSIWSCWRRTSRGYNQGTHFILVPNAWRQLKPCLGYGYPMISLYPGKRTRLIHRLVLEAFIGPCPPGMECCHADGNKSNNALSNLRWDTRKANSDDRDRHGRTLCGQEHGSAKLTAKQVRSIRTNYAAGGITMSQLGMEHGISKNQVSLIVRRTAWKHID